MPEDRSASMGPHRGRSGGVMRSVAEDSSAVTRRRVRRWQVISLTLAVVVVTLGVYALLHQPSSYAQIRFAGASDDRFGIADVYRKSEMETFGSVPVCRTGGKPMLITSVVPQGGPGGLTIVAFAVRPWNGSGFGADEVRLSTAGFSGSHLVSAPCPRSDELGITVHRTAAGDGQWAQVRINFESGGRQHFSIIPFALKMCGPQGKTNDTCGAVTGG